MSPPSQLTPADRQRILALRAENRSMASIADELQCTYWAVRSYLRKNGVALGETRACAARALADEICRRYKAGEGLDEIAAAVDRTRCWVRVILTEEGLWTPNPVIQEAQRRAQAERERAAAENPKPKAAAVLPVAADGWIKPPTRAQLMAGR